MTRSIEKVRESRPRACALLNRERIMVAACEAFTNKARGAVLDEIARRAAIAW